MNQSDRETRIEQYRAESVRADELEGSGRKDEALAILKTNLATATENGDEDYRAFFDAEILNCSAPDYPRQIDRLTEALRWAEDQGLPRDSFLLRSLGMYHSLNDNQDDAIEWYEKALAENPKDWEAMRSIGISLGMKGDKAGAITWFEKALAENPRDWNAMRNMGVSLSMKGDKDGAITWLKKALAENPKDSEAMRSIGISLGMKGDQDGAIAWFEKALAGDPRDWNAMRCMGVSLSRKGDEDGAIKWCERALAENSKDWEATRNMGVSLAKKGDDYGAIAWFERALAINPKYWEAMRDLGVSLSRMGNEDGAIAWFEKALEGNPKDRDAMRQMGISLCIKGDEDGAIGWFEKALAEDPRDWETMRQMGVSLSKQADQDGAIGWFEKALAENPKDWDAMRQMGVSFSIEGDDDSAIAWYQQALTENPKDSASRRGLSVSEWSKGNPDEAMRQIRLAVQLEPTRWQADFRACCKVCGLNADAEWARLFPDETPAEPEPAEDLTELSAFIDYVRRAFRSKATRYLNSQDETEKARQAFLEPRSWLDPSRSLLMVLRRWNSYTPALPSDVEERSIGGGYFIWHNGHGTVIDPGYDFLDNFNRAGCRLCDVDNVILTHAHNDHTIEFESLRTLLHQFNDKARKEDREPKQVRFFLNNGAFKKFAGMLDFKDRDFTDRMLTMNPGQQLELLGGGRLTVLPAYHDEVLARDQAVGLLLDLSTTKGDRKILFTSDTGLFPLDPDASKPVADARDNEAEIWRQYLNAGGEQPDVMVVHIGAVHRKELDSRTARDPSKACYPNHLGLIGTARVIASCRPKLAVVSEFGEEMKDFRLELVKALQQEMLTPLFRGDPSGYVPRTIPGDLAFFCDLAQEQFYTCVNDDWRPLAEIDFEGGDGKDQQGIYYFTEDEREEYEKEPSRHVQSFNTDRKSRKRMYFRQAPE